MHGRTIHTPTASLCAAGLLLALGCGGEDTRRGGSGDGPTADPGGDSRTPPASADASMGTTPPDGGTGTSDALCRALGPGPASTDEPRSRYPALSAYVTDVDFSLVSFGFEVTEDGDERGPLLALYAVVRNDGFEHACQALPDVRLDGEEIVALVHTPLYWVGEVGNYTLDCIPPGGTGILSGLARGISEADVAGASSLAITVDASNLFDTYIEATPPEIRDRRVERTEDGWALTGEMIPHVTLRNYSLRVYPVDADGLIVDELLAFPGELGTHGRGAIVPFETEGAPCRFEEHLALQSWIVEDDAGAARLRLPPSDRYRAITRRKLEIERLRAGD